MAMRRMLYDTPLADQVTAAADVLIMAAAALRRDDADGALDALRHVRDMVETSIAELEREPLVTADAAAGADYDCALQNTPSWGAGIVEIPSGGGGARRRQVAVIG